MSFVIRRLVEADLSGYREIRLESLKAHPEAFGDTYEAAVQRDASHFLEGLRRMTIFGASANERLVGLAAYAASEVKQLHLCVTAGNDAAIRLYERAGFHIYGTEPRSLYVDGRYIDEHLMVRFLDKAPGKKNEHA